MNRQSIYTLGIFLMGVSLQPAVAKDGDACVECHKTENPGLYNQWQQSKHGQNNINCLDCHKAEPTDVDAFKHYGFDIAIIVSPKDCASCHEKEAAEFKRSYHSRAGQILPSDEDNVFGAIVGGHAAVTVGCEQCHGSKVELDKNNKPSKGWPNTGIGRINPDGSFGACTACHNRHNFSRALARTPEACGKCHLGPDHPQIEIYTESKHGNMYFSGIYDLNLDSDTWVAGEDYSAAPTCATCHIGAANGLPSTHDMDERLSWNLRAKVSHKINLLRLKDGRQYDYALLNDGKPLPQVGDTYQPPPGKGEAGEITSILTWENRRDNMKVVCKACHSSDHANKHYDNLDNFVDLYNEKFAKPTSAVMAELAAKNLINKVPNDEWIEWLWWELWHHEGRRARAGAAMMGPDYAWWHGIYEVARRFYMEFIPELIDHAGEAKGWALINKHFKPIDEHSWYFDGLATRPPLQSVIIINPETGEEMARGDYATLEPIVHNGTGLDIAGKLTINDVEIPDVGKLVGKKSGLMVLIVDQAAQRIYVLKTGGKLDVWFGDFAQLEALKTITLKSTQDIKVTSKLSNVKGKLGIYLGYRLENALMYFPEAIGVVVTE